MATKAVSRPGAKAPVNAKNEVAKTQSAGVPSAIAGLMDEDAGKGVSTAAEDNIVPLVYVLQAQSPQATSRDPAYIQGAEAGDIWLRNAGADPIVKGAEGFLFQQCYWYKEWVEWTPRDDGGGYAGRHIKDDKEELEDFLARLDAEEVKDPKDPERVIYVRSNGNHLVETRVHVGWILGRGAPMPYSIALSSSGHTVSKGWMFKLNGRFVKPGVKAPSWGTVFLVKTEFKQNKKGQWFQLDPQVSKAVEGVCDENGWVVTADDVARGKTLYEAFASGAKQTEAPMADGDADAAGDPRDNGEV